MKGIRIPSIVFPLLSLTIYSVGHGLLSTLVTVRLSSEGVSNFWIGLVSSAYFAGLILGTFVNARLIGSVGHIRAFAAYASVLAALVLLLGLIVRPEVWVVARLLGGFATGGLLVVIESWLLSSTQASKRGVVMALYMILFYGSLALGQMILKVVDLSTMVPFAICAISASLSVVPLALARVNMPVLDVAKSISTLALFRLTPSGMTSSFSAGLVQGAVYGLLPLFFSISGYDLSNTADMMAIVIVGGMVLQYPIGKLSDLTDRRLVLAALFGVSTVISLFFVWFDPIDSFNSTALFVFLLGGAMFSLYPISLSHACDEVEPGLIMSVNQGLLLAYSIGAMLGPILAPMLIEVRGPMGLFAYFAVVGAGMVIYLLYRRSQKGAVPMSEHVAYKFTTPNTPIMAEIDPRAEYPESSSLVPEFERRHTDLPQDGAHGDGLQVDDNRSAADPIDHPERRRSDNRDTSIKE